MKIDSYIKLVDAALENVSDRLNTSDADSLLELLFLSYTDCNGVNTDSIREEYRKVYQRLSGVSFDVNENIMDSIADLCWAHEKAAFEEGVKVGVRLAKEVEWE